MCKDCLNFAQECVNMTQNQEYLDGPVFVGGSLGSLGNGIGQDLRHSISTPIRKLSTLSEKSDQDFFESPIENFWTTPALPD